MQSKKKKFHTFSKKKIFFFINLKEKKERKETFSN